MHGTLLQPTTFAGLGAVAFWFYVGFPSSWLAAVMPSLCYLLLSRFWLLGWVAGDLGGGTPRRGHPVTAPTR